MYTDKQQTKTKILKLVSKLIPALVLSLLVLSVGGGRVSASAPIGTVILTSDRYYPSSNDLLSISTGNQASFSAPFGPTSELPYSASQLIPNPCSSTPVDISLTMDIQYSGTPESQSFGYLAIFGIDSGGSVDPVQNTAEAITINNQGQTVTVSAVLNGVTTPNVALEPILVSQAQLDETQMANEVVLSVSRLEYVVTYPDDMADCTYPNPDPTPTNPTPTSTPTLYCPAPGSTTEALSPTGDCDGDGITNQEEGYDPDGDTDPNTGTKSVDTDKDGTPDYLDTDSDNDKLLDKDEGTKDTNNNKIPDFRDPTKTLANTGTSLNLILSLSALAIIAGFGLKKLRG